MLSSCMLQDQNRNRELVINLFFINVIVSYIQYVIRRIILLGKYIFLTKHRFFSHDLKRYCHLILYIHNTVKFSQRRRVETSSEIMNILKGSVQRKYIRSFIKLVTQISFSYIYISFFDSYCTSSPLINMTISLYTIPIRWNI